MKRSETIFYEVHNGSTLITNKCSCACTFCIRNSSNQVGNANTLWLDHDPSFKEKEALDAISGDLYEEIVFCGYGEPTEALDVLLKLAKEIKRRATPFVLTPMVMDRLSTNVISSQSLKVLSTQSPSVLTPPQLKNIMNSREAILAKRALRRL